MLRHPDVDDLTANSIVWPISIPIFFLDGVIRRTVQQIKIQMDKVRDSLSDSI